MAQRIYFIYKYTFPNGKIYIGQTYKGSRRFGKVSEYAGTLVYRAMKKYPSFKKEIIEYCSEELVDEREKYWIAFYDSSNRNKGYNRDSGGNSNKRLSEDLKRELSKKHKGLYDVPVLQYDLRGNFLKEWPSQRSVLDELGISVNACCKGRQKTAGGYQWRNKGDDRPVTDIYNPIEQYDLQGNLIKVWETIEEASEKTGVSKTGIVTCCSNKNKSAGGFQWKYRLDVRVVGKYTKQKSPTAFKKGRKSYNAGVGRKVSQFDLQGNFIRIWDCIATAQKELKIFGISKCCKKETKTAGGFQWKYADDPREVGAYIKEKHPMSEETKQKLSKAKKGKPSKLKGRGGMKGTSNPRATPVLQFTISDEFVKEWDYITKASKELGINISSLSECLKGKQKTAGGYKWKYK